MYNSIQCRDVIVKAKFNFVRLQIITLVKNCSDRVILNVHMFRQTCQFNRKRQCLEVIFRFCVNHRRDIVKQEIPSSMAVKRLLTFSTKQTNKKYVIYTLRIRKLLSCVLITPWEERSLVETNMCNCTLTLRQEMDRKTIGWTNIWKVFCSRDIEIDRRKIFRCRVDR